MQFRELVIGVIPLRKLQGLFVAHELLLLTCSYLHDDQSLGIRVDLQIISMSCKQVMRSLALCLGQSKHHRPDKEEEAVFGMGSLCDLSECTAYAVSLEHFQTAMFPK